MDNQDKIRVFLPWAERDKDSRNDLQQMLLNAGFDVVPPLDMPSSELDFIEEVKDAVDDAQCALFYLNHQYESTMRIDEHLSITRFQFNSCVKHMQKDPNFKLFIWYPESMVDKEKEALQEEFINEIRYNLKENMIFSSINSPIQMVDDLRSMMEPEDHFEFDINNTEIFIMFNELDEMEASDIVDMLGDIVDVEKLNIIQDQQTEYLEYCTRQIKLSKLAVIYFKETSEWALPFVQQVWKNVGGASSHTPILLIGDDDPETNMNKKFNAPKVASIIISGELIPLEIKVQYDKVSE